VGTTEQGSGGGPLNQPGGHWERAATCKLKGIGVGVVQSGVGELQSFSIQS
jgi:hypothetical protein